MPKDKAVVIQREVAPIISEALEVEIKGKEDMKIATELLSKLNKVADRIDEEKAKVLDPLNEARKAEMARWKPLEIQYGKAIEYLRAEISAYQTAEIKRQREEEAKIAARVGEGKGKIKIETAVKKMEKIDKPETMVTTEVGVIKFREQKVIKYIDEKLVPREYLIVDEKKVLDALKAGVSVPGCVLDSVQVPVNSR